jgi:polygalacturonase
MPATRRAMLRSALAGLAGASAAIVARAAARADAGAAFDAKSFGAVGDGRAIDSDAINRAIAATAEGGGGIVRIPAGHYACHSIRLQSLVTLVLEPGATILAAASPGFDAAESNAPWEAFQDFGHNHWHNSLIWGEGVHDVAILGPGLISGRGLARGIGVEDGLPSAEAPGVANKAIALKRCHNVVLRDFAIREAGHFGILATGVDNLTIDGLTIDTNRDGLNVDCCRNVAITDCSVNSPFDDGICLKSSYALGEARATENVTIRGCHVSGYRVGSLLDATYRPVEQRDPGVPTGRIKFGTESNGGFKNITVNNCTFASCRGFALETVDGGIAEDITFTGVTMRDIRNAPFFLRLGARLRGPPGAEVGRLRRVIISDVTCYAPASDMPAIICGIRGHPVEEVSIDTVFFAHKGGGTAAMAEIVPPEAERAYPEPRHFGPLPAQGLFARHVRDLSVSNVEIATEAPDARPFYWLADVQRVDFFRLRLPREPAAPAFSLHDTEDFRVYASSPVPDARLDSVNRASVP